VSLFQRITTPFGEPEEDASDRLMMHNAAGELLRERRQQLQLDLDAVAEALCIKPVYIAAIEQGRTEELPGPTYAIGFIRAYATYLGLDGERVLDSYREEKADVQTRPDLTLPVPLGERGVPGLRVLLTGLVLALCGYGAWYYVSTGERERPERVAAVPAELQLLTAPAPSVQTAAVQTTAVQTAAVQTAPIQGAAPTPGAATATPVPPSAQPASATMAPTRLIAGPQFGSGLNPPPPSATANAVVPDSLPAASDPAGAAAQSPIPGTAPGTALSAGDAASRPENAAASTSGSIDIRARADSWIQIRDADQGIVFSRVLKAGETYRVPRTGLILRTGNAGALEVLVDGKPAPSLGALGTLRRNVTLEPDALLAGTAVRG
jgi:cytoskeleton protein RodZ